MAIATADDKARVGLLKCTPDSVATSVVQAAQAGLRIDGRQSALIPHGNKAVWYPMVKGRIDLIMRAPHVVKVVSRHVLDCDDFSYELGHGRVDQAPAASRAGRERQADARLRHRDVRLGPAGLRGPDGCADPEDPPRHVEGSQQSGVAEQRGTGWPRSARSTGSSGSWTRRPS